MLERHLPRCSVRHDLEKIPVCIVDNERRCSCKVLVSPSVGKDVHGDPCMLKALAFGKFHGFFYKLAVRTAYEPVFIFVVFGGARRFGGQIFGKEMER